MVVPSGNSKLDEKIGQWLKWDQNSKTKMSIENMAKEKKFDELAKIMLTRLSFGTAGLRARMAPGFNCMNDLVILQSAQGLLKNLEKYAKKRLDENGIVIGYDGRYNSKRFAEITANIFLRAGKKVMLFSTTTPTPFVPFCVKRHNLAAGVMVTASHNPKEDNGYKVYSWNGAQIISPEDKNILIEIENNLEPWPESWNLDILESSPLLTDPIKETYKDYMKIVDEGIPEKYKEINKKSPLIFTYSAMHGVGYPSIQKAMDLAGIKIVPVMEQRDPDPEFSTVKFPNPEEGKSSLNLSFQTADCNNSFTILANDPDADRLAVAEKDERTGEWKVFTGNEIGALLGWWSYHLFKEQNPNTDMRNVYMLASTVSSKILRTMSNDKGFNFIETLTGFKWMGTHTYDLLQQNKTVLFAFEEAIGFMWGTAVLDKDGVSAAAQVGTMCAYLHSISSCLIDKLNEIWDEHGHHITNNSYYVCHQPDITKRMFERLRNYDGPNTYPNGLLNGKYNIKHIRDLTTGYDDSQLDKKAVLPVSSSSQMVTFTFDNGLVATLRTSGTEPKIKYYTELCASPDIKDRTEVVNISNEMVAAIISEWYEPEKNGFIPQEC